MEREDQIGRRKLSDGAERKVITGEEKTRMCGILFLAVALMPTRWRMFVSVTCVGEIRTSCEARSTHPCARSISCRGRHLSVAPWFLLRSLAPLPKEEALLFRAQGSLAQRGVDESRGFRV